MVEKHHILMQEQGSHHVKKPLWEWQAKRAHDGTRLLTLWGFHVGLAPNVPHVPWPGGGRVEDEGGGGSIFILAADVLQTRGLEVVVSGFDPLRGGRAQGELETLIGGRWAHQLHRHRLRSRVPVPHNTVVRNGHVGGVHHVLHEVVPSIRHIPHAPRQVPPAAVLSVLNQLWDQPWGLEVCLKGHIRARITSLPPNPQNSLKLLGRVRLGAGLWEAAQFVMVRWVSLRQGHALALPVESPGVVGTQQVAVILNPALTQGRQAVRAGVFKDTPGTSAIGSILVPPDHQLLPQELCAVGPCLVNDLRNMQGPPLLGPAELGVDFFGCGLKIVHGLLLIHLLSSHSADAQGAMGHRLTLTTHGKAQGGSEEANEPHCSVQDPCSPHR
mmetsp:Transcript_11955/g.21706  ORF Transcript_11955/g.21706 Transcript_11955/m.21706 type:complete len:385 (+) Transcript_11955:1801-2955(+)